MKLQTIKDPSNGTPLEGLRLKWDQCEQVRIVSQGSRFWESVKGAKKTLAKIYFFVSASMILGLFIKLTVIDFGKEILRIFNAVIQSI